MRKEPTQFIIQDNTVFLLMKTARVLHYHLDHALRAYGVTAVQFSVMNLIGERNDAITSAEIASGLRTDRPTISGILRRLEDKGYLKRRMHPEDRRAEILQLSGEAMTLLRQIRQQTDQFTSALENALEAQQLAGFRRSLKIMLDNLEEEGN